MGTCVLESLDGEARAKVNESEANMWHTPGGIEGPIGNGRVEFQMSFMY